MLASAETREGSVRGGMGRPDGDPREAPGRLPFMPPSDKRVRPVEVRALKA